MSGWAPSGATWNRSYSKKTETYTRMKFEYELKQKELEVVNKHLVDDIRI